MKYLFTLCLLIVSLSGISQWQQTGARVRYVNGLGIPTRDTAAGVAADSSQILIRPADSSLYIKYKRTWVKVGAGGTMGGSGTTNRVPKFTGATTLGNSSIVDSASAVAMTINPSGNVGIGTPDLGANGLSLSNVYNLSFSEGSGESYANIFRQRNTVATVIAHSLKRSSTANFASSFTGSIGKAAIAVGFDNGSISFFSDPASNVANGTDFTATERMRITSGGNALIGTTTDNGVDRLQVSGSMNVSATATVNNLSSTNNITTRTVFAGSDQSGSVDGLVITAGNEKGFVINNTNTTGVASQSRFTFKNNGADRGLFYYSEAAQTFSFQSSGAARNIQIASEGGVGFYMTGANANVRIGASTAANAPLSVNGFALINTNTNNSVDALQVNGAIQGNGLRQAYLARTTAYTITNNDYFIDCTSGTFTVTLPASSGGTGRIFVIKNSGTGTITVDGNGAETIDGAATYSLSAQWATVQLMCDGNNWKIISKF